MLPKQAQHVAEAAITARQAVKKARRRAEEAVAELEAAVFNREQLIAAVADLRRAISAQAAEETIAASAQTPHPLQFLDMNSDILDRHAGSCTGQEGKLIAAVADLLRAISEQAAEGATTVSARYALFRSPGSDNIFHHGGTPAQPSALALQARRGQRTRTRVSSSATHCAPLKSK